MYFNEKRRNKRKYTNKVLLILAAIMAVVVVPMAYAKTAAVQRDPFTNSLRKNKTSFTTPNVQRSQDFIV
jgi:hypothetical protein